MPGVVAADDRDLDLGRLDDRDAHVAAAALPDDLVVEQGREVLNLLGLILLYGGVAWWRFTRQSGAPSTGA